MSYRIKNAVWGAVGGNTLNGANSGTLAAVPDYGPAMVTVEIQARLQTNNDYLLMLSFEGVAGTVAASEKALANLESYTIDLQRNTVIGWRLTDSTGASQNGGANDYLSVEAYFKDGPRL